MERYFSDVIGYGSVKRELYRLCDRLTNPDKYKKLGVGTPHGLLLHGEPGVGKTTFINCMVKALQRPSFICRKDKPNGEFVNHIREVFRQAREAAPSVVVLDDLDKYANEDHNHRDCEEYVTVQSCIDEVRDLDVYVVATANSYEKLPDSLLRAGRFDNIIPIDIPHGADAIKIVAHYLSRCRYTNQIDAAEVARLLDGYSCAVLATVINEAGIYAGFNGQEEIHMEDIINAVLRVVFEAPEALEDDPIIEAVAIHEAGHTVVSEVLEPGSVGLVSVRHQSDEVCGITSIYRADDYFHSKQRMDNRVMVLLAGKAAVELCLGVVDMGAENDLLRSSQIVHRLVARHASLGFGSLGVMGITSESRRQYQEEQVAGELDRLYHQTRQLLMENRNFLDRVTQALIADKTLMQEQLRVLRCA